MYQRFILIKYQTATLHREKPLLIHLITFHREKRVFEGELQTMILKKIAENPAIAEEFRVTALSAIAGFYCSREKRRDFHNPVKDRVFEI